MINTKEAHEICPETVSFDCSQISWHDQYKLFSGAIVPRPIALVSTIGPAGVNAAPFSFFNAVALGPPMLMFSLGPPQFEKKGSLKDTLINIQATKDFVVQLVDDANLEKMNMCSPEYSAGVSEIEKAGFQTAASLKVKSPRITDCPVQFECVLHEIIELGSTPYHMVIGEVVQAHFHSNVVNDRFHVDMAALNPIGRLANPGIYTRISDRFQLLAPSIESSELPQRKPV